MLPNLLILCYPLLLLPSVFPSIRVFSSNLALHVRWAKYWSFSFSISPSDDYSGLISFRIDWFDLLAVQRTLKSLLHVRKHQFLGIQPSLWSNSHIHTWLLEKPLSAMRMHTSPPYWTSLPPPSHSSRWSQSVVLYSKFPLAVTFTHGNVCMSILMLI